MRFGGARRIRSQAEHWRRAAWRSVAALTPAAPLARMRTVRPSQAAAIAACVPRTEGREPTLPTRCDAGAAAASANPAASPIEAAQRRRLARRFAADPATRPAELHRAKHLGSRPCLDTSRAPAAASAAPRGSRAAPLPAPTAPRQRRIARAAARSRRRAAPRRRRQRRARRVAQRRPESLIGSRPRDAQRPPRPNPLHRAPPKPAAPRVNVPVPTPGAPRRAPGSRARARPPRRSAPRAAARSRAPRPCRRGTTCRLTTMCRSRPKTIISGRPTTATCPCSTAAPTTCASTVAAPRSGAVSTRVRCRPPCRSMPSVSTAIGRRSPWTCRSRAFPISSRSTAN